MAGPWEAYASAPQSGGDGPWASYAAASPRDFANSPPKQGMAGNILAGAVKGASDIGSTLLRPVDALLNATGISDKTNSERRQQLKDFFSENADPESLAFKGGELAADVAGTAGVGGVLAKGAKALGAGAKVATALESGGLSLGPTASRNVANFPLRAAAGAITGGASAGLVNPDDLGAGAAIGGALPGAAKLAGSIGKGIRKGVAGEISPEVEALYQKAKGLGIDIPADRIANSRPLNAMAASLNYVPLSGRAATEDKMFSQMSRALSKTFGQDSDNVTQALRKASGDLGGEFDRVLKSNAVNVDQQLVGELQGALQNASKELNTGDAQIIKNQIDDILDKGAAGSIDGQTAYNIKKTLDRIGNRNSNEAFYARDLKRSLMGALDRSLGPKEAAAFAKTRQQYGTMLDLEKLAGNGAEGGISFGKLANMKARNINNPELQDLADIAAQFLKTRESPHGAAQRVGLGTLAAGAGMATGTLPLIAGGMVGARATNALLNSQTVKNAMLNKGGGRPMLANPVLRNALIQGAIPGRAAGGPVDADQPYIVGENGPELVVPKRRGTVVPTNRLAALADETRRLGPAWARTEDALDRAQIQRSMARR